MSQSVPLTFFLTSRMPLSRNTHWVMNVALGPTHWAKELSGPQVITCEVHGSKPDTITYFVLGEFRKEILQKNVRVAFGNYIGLSTCNDSRTAERFFRIWRVLLASLRQVSVLVKWNKERTFYLRPFMFKLCHIDHSSPNALYRRKTYVLMDNWLLVCLVTANNII